MIDYIVAEMLVRARRAVLVGVLVLAAAFGAGFGLRAWLGRPIATEFACPRLPSAFHQTADKPSGAAKGQTADIAKLVVFAINDHWAVIEFVSRTGEVVVFGAKDCEAQEKCKAAVEAMAIGREADTIVINVHVKTGIET
jgi:hypothetical protein